MRPAPLLHLKTLYALAIWTHVRGAENAEPRIISHQDILSNFHASWEAASRFMGLDPSQGVASLVSASFSPSEKQDYAAPDTAAPPASLFHGFFRLLGFDATKLNAIAINAVVFIAKMIGSSIIRNFTEAPNGRNLDEEELPEGTPLSWILEDVKERAQPLLARAQDPGLVDQLMSALEATPTRTECIQLLVCRSGPLLAGMQRSLRTLVAPAPSPSDPWDSGTFSPLQRMYYFLPSRQELRDSAISCGRRVPSCAQLFTAFDQ